MSRRSASALALLVSAQFVVMLDTSIVNVALPSIQSELDMAPHTLSWVVNAYLTFGGLLLLLGGVGDLVGRRRMFVIGSALFAAGTLLAGAAGTAALEDVQPGVRSAAEPEVFAPQVELGIRINTVLRHWLHEQGKASADDTGRG